MFRRIVFAAAISGVLSGISLTVLQALEVAPLIFEAETFEQQVPEQSGAGHEPPAAWSPRDGWERMLYTALANSGAGIGFALLLCALFAVRAPISAPQGALWGTAGFVVFYLNPALGLPPELPGTVAAPLIERQLWWLATVIGTAAGLALLVFTRPWYRKLAGLALLAVPHLVGPPHADYAIAAVPDDLARQFVIAATWTNGACWLLLGSVSAWVFRRLNGA